MITTVHPDIEQLRKQLVEQDQMIVALNQTILHLQEQLNWFKRQIFGKKSERIAENPDQLQITFEGFESLQVPNQEQIQTVPAHRGTFKLKPMAEVVQGLRNGTISPESLPIEIIVRNGQKITLNNRSLLVLIRAGMGPKVIIDRTGIQKYETFLDHHLKGNLPSDIIQIRGGPPGTSFIAPIE